MKNIGTWDKNVTVKCKWMYVNKYENKLSVLAVKMESFQVLQRKQLNSEE